MASVRRNPYRSAMPPGTSDDESQQPQSSDYPSLNGYTNNSIWNTTTGHGRGTSMGLLTTDAPESNGINGTADASSNPWNTLWRTDGHKRSTSTSPNHTRDNGPSRASTFGNGHDTAAPPGLNGSATGLMGRPVPANGTMANGRSSFQDPSSSAPRQAQASSFADLYNGGLVASQSNRANGHARTGSRPSATMSNQAANNRAFTLNAQVDNDMPGSFGNSRRGSAAAAPQSYASSPYGGLGDDDQLDSLTQHLTLNGLTNHRHTPSYSQFGDDSSRPYAPSQASWLPRLPRNGLPSHSGGDFERRGSGQSAGFPQSVSQQPSAPRAPQQPSFNLPQQPGYYQQPQPYNDLGQQLLHLQAVQSLVGGNGHYATQNMAYANAAANQTYSDPTYGGMGLPGFSLANGAGGPIGYSPTVAALAQAQAQAQTPQGLGMNHVAIQRASGHGTAHPLTSSTLSDFKANRTSRNWTFNEIWGHLAEFSGDQHGSRLVQQLLSDANSEDKERAFCELEPNAVQLMRDVFGNYVVQKFFEYGTQVHKRILADKIRARIFELSIQTYACRVVQVAFQHILLEQQLELIQGFGTQVLAAMRDQNGNHVIQKIVTTVDNKHLDFAMAALKGSVTTMSSHQYGCRVVQRMLDSATPEDREALMAELRSSTASLMSDQFGNYVAQNIIQHGSFHDRQRMVQLVLSDLMSLCRHKFASNVVEKCIIWGTPELRTHILGRFREPGSASDGSNAILTLMRDNFGNYVLQKLAICLKGAEQRDFIENDLVPTCQTLKRISGLPPGPVPTTQRSDSSPARQIIAIDTIIEQFRKNALTPALRGYGDAREVAPAPDAPAPEGVVDLAPPGTTPTSTGVVAAADAQ